MSSGQRLSGSVGSAPQLSAQELRARRLAALSGGAASTPTPIANSTVSATTTRTPVDETPKEAATMQTPQEEEEKFEQQQNLSSQFLNDFFKLLFDPNSTTEADRMRWFEQPIHTTNMKHINEQKPCGNKNENMWGLSQQQGGPCGVISSIQAEIIKSLKIYENLKRNITEDEARIALCDALAVILARAALAPPLNSEKSSEKSTSKTCVNIVLASDQASIQDFTLCEGDAFTIQRIELSPSIRKQSTKDKIQQLTDKTRSYLLEKEVYLQFAKPFGCILFLLSLVTSRNIEIIKKDMDDVHNSFTGQFGHSSQELINLMLTGQATSNTFDHSVTLAGGSLACHGIQSQADIGYLTQLEALRYCSVGSFYKSPKFPIWLVGSTSHFTVLFGSPCSLQESESDLLLEKCRRAFKSIDHAEENGFIPVSELGNILMKLELDMGDKLDTLAAHLEMAGSGIIIWASFWKNVSRLLTGASLESVLQTSPSSTEANSDLSDLPLLITQNGEESSGTNRMESDEEMARRLAAEWGTSEMSNPTEESKSDEQLARELQAQFEADSEVAMINSTSSPSSMLESSAQSIKSSTVTSKQSNSIGGMDVESYQNKSFDLHHYNNLREGELTSFTITRLRSEEAVGSDVPLTPSSVSAGSHFGGGEFEAVIRTKFQSCKIHWGNGIPSLH